MISTLKRTVSSLAGKCVLILIFLLAIVGLFELLPAVDHARMMFPADWHKGQDCHDVLRARPWYGRINSWFWFWLISTPVVVFSVRPTAPAWQRAARTIFIIAMSYVVINFGTHLAMDIKNAPFHGDGIVHFNGIRVSSEKDEFKLHCYDIADGAKFVFSLLFGWLFAVIYTGWWEIIWNQYHTSKTKLIDKSFKTDWVNKIIVFVSVAVPAFLSIWMWIDWIRQTQH